MAKLQEILAAKALVARKSAEPQPSDEARRFVEETFALHHEEADEGFTESTVEVPAEYAAYFLHRCKEEGLTTVAVEGGYVVSWGSGE